MQQTSAQHAPASNNNIPYALASAMASSMAALRDYKTSETQRHSLVGRAFASFRLALLAEQVSAGMSGIRNSQSRRSVEAAAATLAHAPCNSALDFAAKAIGLHALVYCSAAYAASRHDAASLISDAEAIADLAAGLAADALALGVTLPRCTGEA
jgi:hypothetical protein